MREFDEATCHRMMLKKLSYILVLMKEQPTIPAVVIMVIIAFCISLGQNIHTWIQVKHVHQTVENENLLSEAMETIDLDTPLALPACFETTEIISLKTKGEQIRHRYNIRYHLCEKIRDHLNDLMDIKYEISDYERDEVLRRLEDIKKGNEALKHQFEKITAYLEEQRARRMTQQNIIEEDKVRIVLEQQNDTLINRMIIPSDRSITLHQNSQHEQTDSSQNDDLTTDDDVNERNFTDFTTTKTHR